MDLYLTSAEPQLSLQDMIDCDIKNGIEFETLDPLSHSDYNSLDLSSMTSFETELDIKNFGSLFDTLDSLEGKCSGGLGMMDTDEPSQEDQQGVGSWMNLSSMSNYSLDLEHSVMVNPSTILPTTLPSRGTTNAVSTASVTTIPMLPISRSSSNIMFKSDINCLSTSSPNSSLSNVSSSSGPTVTTQVTVMKPSSVNGSVGSIRQQPLVASLSNSHHQSSLTSSSGYLSRQVSHKNNAGHQLSSVIEGENVTPTSPNTLAQSNRSPIPSAVVNNR